MTTYITPPAGEDIRTYLFRLAEQLNVALSALDAPQSSGTAAVTAASAESNALRALIANTASAVRSELASSEAALRSDYTALSKSFGTFREGISATVEEAAGTAVRTLGYDAAISALQTEAAGLESYKVHTEGFIRQGFIDCDGFGAPIIGIAIGRGLTATEVTVGGVTYTHLDPSQSCAFYTADRVSFRLNGREAAYISNSRFCMAEGYVADGLTVGDWRIDPSRGFAVKWVGE